ncbi:hypothetical protein, partial [Mucilaginibacter sp.]|uniref:hypothetical protein n=1 Tax=Mucilaginibacter sp. TaxID=1882438 RepID=UPI002633175B
MAYTVTLKIVDCASPMTLLAGAPVNDARNNSLLGYTDSNGQIIIPVIDSYEYIVTISKYAVDPCNPSAPDYRSGYTAKNFVLAPNQDGSIQTVCLNQGPPPQPCGKGISCFIVTAATGSPESEEVTSLRQLRERVRATSRLAGQLIDVIY